MKRKIFWALLDENGIAWFKADYLHFLGFFPTRSDARKAQAIIREYGAKSKVVKILCKFQVIQ